MITSPSGPGDIHDPKSREPATEDLCESSLPKPEGDPWETILTKLLAEDKIQCDAWKDEVQNLLLFAGLFSAVVTAFSVESYKSLRPDSDDSTALLLGLVLSHFDSSSNITLPAQQNTPTPFAVRINVLWFLSLILSLTTVLVGITLLQWLREHQRYSSAEPQLAVGIFHMRAEGMKKWRVRHFFTTLPLLLQSALVLFFVGIIDFLLSLSHAVAAPVIVVVGTTMCFFVVTTILPTLQVVAFDQSVHLDSHFPPVQCPFKSPQSLAFRRLATASELVFMVFYRTICRISDRVSTLRNFFFSHNSHRVKNQYTFYGPSELFFTWGKKDWEEFDMRWLTHRGEYMASTYNQYFMHPGSGRVYDSFAEVMSTLQKYKQQSDILTAGYWCFHQLLSSPNRIDDISLMLRGTTFVEDHVNFLSDYSKDKDTSIRRLEVLERCLLPFQTESQVLLIIGEIKTRILHHHLGNAPVRVRNVMQADNQNTTHFTTVTNDKFWESYIVYFDRYLRSSEIGRMNFWRTLTALITTATTAADQDVLQTFHSSTSAKDVLEMAAVHFYRMDYPFPTILDLLEIFRSGLEKNLTCNQHERPMYIFICATLFLQSLMDFDLLGGRYKSRARFAECILDIGEFLLEYEAGIDVPRLLDVYGHLLHQDDFPSRFLTRFSKDRGQNTVTKEMISVADFRSVRSLVVSECLEKKVEGSSIAISANSKDPPRQY